MLNNGTEFEHALSEGANPKGTVFVAIKREGSLFAKLTNKCENSKDQTRLMSRRI